MNQGYLRVNDKEEDKIKTIEKKSEIQLHWGNIGELKKSETKDRSFNDSYLQRDYINLAYQNRFQRIDNLKNR